MNTQHTKAHTIATHCRALGMLVCLAVASAAGEGAAYFHSDNHHQFPANESPLWMGAFNADSLSGKSIDENGFIFIKDGHFHNKSGRVRFFGLKSFGMLCERSGRNTSKSSTGASIG